jgi:cytochrome P450 family 110
VTPPPGPSENSLFQKVRYLRDPLGYLAECQRTYGDIFTIQLAKHGMVIVCSPELAKAVYTAGDDVIVAGEAKYTVFGKLLGKHSTALLDGREHVRRRRLLLPRFRGDLMHNFGPVMLETCNRTLDELPRDRTFALHPYLHDIAFNVILRALFAATPAELFEPLRQQMYTFATKAVTSRQLMFPQLQRDLGPLSPWGRVARIADSARAAVLDEIRRRRRDRSTSEDIAGLLMAARDEDGSALSDEEVRDEILMMVAAGHETTSIALAWLCHAVFTRPDILDKLLDELAANPVRDGKRIDELRYLDAVVRESLRFNSLIPNGSGRVVKKTFELGGHEIRAGMMVTVAFHAIHRRADVFERPNELWPERFLSTAKVSPYEYLAFGGGSRRCLGMPFAIYEMKIVVAALLDKFRLDIVGAVRPSWRGMFLTPSKGLRVRVRAHPKRRAAA